MSPARPTRFGRPALLAALATAGLTSAALAQPLQQQNIYFQDFESGTSFPGWSTNTITAHSGVFTRFLGRFTNQRATLNVALPALPQDETPPPGGGGGTSWRYQLDFAFYCIDSWDGFDPQFGPDRFRVLINEQVMFNEVFSNANPYQTYRNPDIGPAHMGFNELWVDSIYFLSIPFMVPPGTTAIAFEGSGLQGMSDESWGIDNVRVSMVQIPAPGAAALLSLAAVVAGRRRR